MIITYPFLVTLKRTGAISGTEIEAIDVIDKAALELEMYKNDDWCTVDEKKKNAGWNACIDAIVSNVPSE